MDVGKALFFCATIFNNNIKYYVHKKLIEYLYGVKSFELQ